MILLAHLIGLYFIGVLLAYGLIHLFIHELNIYINPWYSFKSWYFLIEVYYYNKY